MWKQLSFLFWNWPMFQYSASMFSEKVHTERRIPKIPTWLWKTFFWELNCHSRQMCAGQPAAEIAALSRNALHCDQIFLNCQKIYICSSCKCTPNTSFDGGDLNFYICICWSLQLRSLNANNKLIIHFWNTWTKNDTTKISDFFIKHSIF